MSNIVLGKGKCLHTCIVIVINTLCIRYSWERWKDMAKTVWYLIYLYCDWLVFPLFLLRKHLLEDASAQIRIHYIYHINLYVKHRQICKAITIFGEMWFSPTLDPFLASPRTFDVNLRTLRNYLDDTLKKR